MNNLLLPNVTFIPSETYNIDTVPKKQFNQHATYTVVKNSNKNHRISCPRIMLIDKHE